MPALYRASLGYLLRHPWQLALALLGICIGVAVIVAVDLATQSSRKAFLISMDAITGEATHQIVGGPTGLDEALYTRLRVEEGVRNIAPVVTGYVRVADQTLQVLGVDLFAERQIRSFTSGARQSSTGEGASTESLFRGFLAGRGNVLMSRHTASALSLNIGDKFSVSASGKQFDATLLDAISDEQSSALSNLIVTDISNAQEWLDQAGWLSRIDVRLVADDNKQADQLRALLPADALLLDANGRTQSMAEMSTAFMTNLTAMSLLALLVGIFLIYNSVGFAVLQRRPLIGILRALGVTREQSFALILSEAAVLGIVGAVLGVVVGIWLGEQLLVLVSRSINDFYFRTNVTEVSVDAIAVGKGVAAGLCATLLAATVPAIEAASFRPRLAMTRSALESRTGRLLPTIAAAGIGLGVVAVFLLRLSGSNLVAGLSAVFILILGFALCVPLAVKHLAAFLEPLAARIAGMPGRLAVSGIGASLSRTGVAIVALAVAISATVGVSVMVDSFRVAVSAWLDKTLQSDIYVGAPGGNFDASLVTDLAGIDRVENYSTSRRVWLENEEGRTRIVVLQMAPGSYAGTEIIDADPAEAWHTFDNDNGVFVSEPYAYRNDVAAGDVIDLNTRFGSREFRVAATYQSYDVNAGAVLMHRHTYDRFWDDPGIDSIGLYLSSGSDVEDVMQQLREISEGRQELFMRSNQDIRDLSLQIFDRTFIITDVLYWLATGVALIGILGAMLALQLERTRELAVLRALGMTQGQLAGMVTLQTGVIGLLSGLAALPLGLVMAWVLINVINRRAFGWQMDMFIEPRVLTTAILFAVVAAILAGIYPAYLAASSRPALAMREE